MSVRGNRVEPALWFISSGAFVISGPGPYAVSSILNNEKYSQARNQSTLTMLKADQSMKGNILYRPG